jgi:hypothetical protein
MLRLGFTLSFFFFSISELNAQNWFFIKTDTALQDSFPKNSFIQIRYQLGKFANSHTEGVKYIEANPLQAVELRYGIEGYGRKKWHMLHHYPTYGLGVSKYWFKPTENILGNPIATYLFFNQSFLQSKRSSFGYDFSIGLSYNWKPYQTQNNPAQNVIGSAINVFVGFALQYDVTLSKQIDLIIGPGVSHFSNGRVRSPNRGVNLYSGNASLRYHLSRNQEGQNKSKRSYRGVRIKHHLESFKPLYEFYTVGNVGIVTTFQDVDKPSIYFWASSINLDFARHYSHIGKYGIGIDWFYDGSLKETYQNKFSNNEVPARFLFWPGVHISHEYMVHRWTLVTQAGLNLKMRGDKGLWFGRFALRYDVSKSIFVRAGVRVYQRFYSDAIELGLGYAFYKTLLRSK